LHSVAGVLPPHVTWQLSVPVQLTVQAPVQTTAQSVTDWQLTSLPGPTSTEHCRVS